MRQKLLVLLFVCTAAISFGQNKYDFGEKFSFNSPEETNPQLVMVDNYNTYLLSIVNVDGMMSSHKAIIRKFDQKNQLVGTFSQDFQKLDVGTLYNYLGFKEVNNDQVAVFAESYSGKEKKKDVYKYVFDKATAKFTVSLVVSWPIESAMKSGSTELEVSDNGRYIGIINKRDPSKKEPVQDNVVMLDASTLAVTWQKEVLLDEKTYDRAFTVTNSGKAVLLRAAKGMKLSNYLVVVSPDKQEEKQFEEAVMLHNPKAISIGTADYIIDFNFDAKGLRKGDFEKLMLYDLANGKTLKNNNINEYNSLKDVSSVNITNVILQNNEIHLFAEAKVKAGTRPVKTNAFSSMSFEEPYYKFGPANLIIMSFDGEVKEIKKLGTDYNALADFYHSFGLLNINGKYYINTGSNNMVYEQPYEKNAKAENSTGIGDPKDPYNKESPKYVAQLFSYVRDAKKFILCRIHYDNKMSLVSVTGFPKQ